MRKVANGLRLTFVCDQEIILGQPFDGLLAVDHLHVQPHVDGLRAEYSRVLRGGRKTG